MHRLLPRERVDRALKAVAVVLAAALLPLVPNCAFLSATGKPCPMCGGTRSISCILRGDIRGALDWNSCALPWVAFAALIASSWMLGALFGRGIDHPRWWSRSCWMVFAVLSAATVVAWLLRLSGVAFPWPEAA